jgi:hypothetical protein
VKLSPFLQPVHTVVGPVDDSLSNKQPSIDSLANTCIKNGPWSLDWMENNKPISEGGVVFSSKRKEDAAITSKQNSSSRHSSKSCKPAAVHKGGVAIHSAGFLKKIARLPAADRKQILRLLKKQRRKNIKGSAHNISKPSEVSTSNSSKSSNTVGSGTANNDWVNWMHLQGKEDKVKEDVRELGKVVGVKVNCDVSNSFNLLSRDGRREWRAAGGFEKLTETEGGVEGVVGES